MMSDMDIRLAIENAAKMNVEAMLGEDIPPSKDPFLRDLANARIMVLRNQITGMITLAWQLGWEMGWEQGQKELIGDGSSEPDPEVIERMKVNLEKAKQER